MRRSSRFVSQFHQSSSLQKRPKFLKTLENRTVSMASEPLDRNYTPVGKNVV